MGGLGLQHKNFGGTQISLYLQSSACSHIHSPGGDGHARLPAVQEEWDQPGDKCARKCWRSWEFTISNGHSLLQANLFLISSAACFSLNLNRICVNSVFELCFTESGVPWPCFSDTKVWFRLHLKIHPIIKLLQNNMHASKLHEITHVLCTKF